VLLLLISSVAAEPVLRLAFGARLTGAAPAFVYLAAAMTCLAVSVLFAHYLLAVGRTTIVAVLAVGAALTTLLLVVADGRPVQTARLDLLGQAAVMGIAGLLVLRAARRERPIPVT
jgi:O-antigen/teichoic acid export membrane protein